MVKKKIKKNVVRTKSLNFKIPESFSGLNFNQKIIAVTLIVLVIGVVASLFPGNVTTGMATTGFQNVFEPLKGLLGGVNDLITTIFGAFFPGEKDPLQVYARFVLFSLVIGIIYFVMKAAGSENVFVNILVGIAIAYLSTFFVPMDVILATGILYSTTFMSIALLIPFVMLWIIYFKMPKTKPGYVLRCIFLIIINVLAINFSKISFTNFYYQDIALNIMSILILVTWGAFIYSVYRIFTVKGAEAAESAAISKGIPVLKGTIYDWIGKVAQKMSKKGP